MSNFKRYQCIPTHRFIENNMDFVLMFQGWWGAGLVRGTSVPEHLCREIVWRSAQTTVGCSRAGQQPTGNISRRTHHVSTPVITKFVMCS